VGEGTLGLVHLLFGRTQGQATEFRRFPSVLLSHFSFGTRVVTGDDISVFIVTAVVAVVAIWFFTRTKFGVAVRAAAENVDAARLLGISSDRGSTFAWVAGTVLSGQAGILLRQTSGAPGEGL